jgi:hypothetical protein
MSNKITTTGKNYLNIVRSFIFLLFILIIVSPETSLVPAISITKNQFWSFYNYKLGFFTIIDYFIFIFIFLLCFKFMKGSINLGRFVIIINFFLLYLFIGIFYNIFVNLSLKAFLFDIKILSYSLIAYLILINFFPKNKFNINYILAILILVFIGSLYDNLIVNFFFTPQYQSRLFHTVIFKNEIIPPILVSLFFFGNYSFLKKLFIFFLIILQIAINYDISSLGMIFYYLTSIYIAILILILNKFFQRSKFFLILIFFNVFFVIHLLPLFLIFADNFFSNIKVDGWSLRRTEFINFVFNSLSDFTIILGKGIGSTWHENFKSTYSNVYSSGPFQGDYKYIWHSSIANQFIKWGIFGYSFLVYCIYLIFFKLIKGHNQYKNLLSYLLITVVYLNLVSPGILKMSIISGIILYFIDQQLSENEN